MRRTLFFFIFLLFLLFLFTGCQSTKQAVPSEPVVTENLTPEEENVSESSPSATACQPQWKCISSKVRAFQNESCQFTLKETCPLTCVMENGTCLMASCDEGFFCRGTSVRGYQDKYCSWMLEEKCEFGCKKGKCLNSTEKGALLPEEENTTVKEEEKKIDPYEGVAWLSLGETVTFTTKNGVQTVNKTLKISIIEAGRVKVMVDSSRSDWLGEGDIATFEGGTITVTIVEIQFQPYVSGVQRVGYRLYVQ